MSLRAGAVEVADDGRHAGLVAHHGRQVDGLLRVVLREPVSRARVSLVLAIGWRGERVMLSLTT